MKNSNDIFFHLSKLNTDELQLLSEKIMMQLKGIQQQKQQESSYPIACRKCGTSDGISKYGKDKNGKQRYRCKHCGSVFSETSYSIVSNTHCSISQWEKYVEVLLQGFSIRKCAESCNISERTAFIWRHKILSALQHDQDNRVLGGVVEADDTFYKVSFKGNHSKSKKFTMPRNSFKRGNDNKQKAYQRASVMFATERKGQMYAEVLGLGPANAAMLSYAFDHRLDDGAVCITDDTATFKKFFDAKGIEIVQIVSHGNFYSNGAHTKGSFHIQTVNNAHQRFRKFVRKYNGVSTKYLNHYVNMFVWIENHKKIEEISLVDNLSQTLREQGTYRSSKNIFNLPAIPSVA